jgi:hypothetical protein
MANPAFQKHDELMSAILIKEALNHASVSPAYFLVYGAGRRSALTWPMP